MCVLYNYVVETVGLIIVHMMLLLLHCLVYMSRENGFAVVSMDKVSTGPLLCPTTEEAQEWVDAINSTISALNAQSVSV